jgi:hypothetical protein
MALEPRQVTGEEANPELVQAQFDEFMTAAREKLFVLSYQLRV